MRTLATLLALLAVVSLSSAQVFSEDPTTASDVVYRNLDQIGWSPVLIKIDVPNYKPEGALVRQSDRLRQRSAINSVADRLIQALDGNHVRLLRRYNRLPYLALEVDRAGLEAISNNPFITLITANIAGQAAASSPPEVVMDSRAATQALLEPYPRSMPIDTSRLVVGADVANANGCDGTGWAVAIIDSGIDLDHNAFVGRVVSEACYSSTGASMSSICPGGVTESTAPGSGEDCRRCASQSTPSTDCDFQPPGQTACPHGSLVAGAAVGNGSEDGYLVKGVAPESDIISIKVFTRADTTLAACNGKIWKYGCAWVYVSDLMKGIERVVELAETINVGAINLSVDLTSTAGGPGQGTGFSSPCDSEASLSGIKDAIDLARSYGIPTVAAVGNQNNHVCNQPDRICESWEWELTDGRINPPACLSNTISVGYTEDGSYYAGATSGHQSTLDAIGVDSNSDTFMDFWAPGEWITTAWPDKDIFTVRGSSVATPQVSASFAALRSKGGSRGIDYYKSLLESTGVPVQDPRNGVTKPRIDVGAACLALSSISGDIRVLLEGAHTSGGAMEAGTILQDSLPLAQPFGDPWFSSTPLAEASIDAVITMPADAVDWVHVGLRTGTSGATTVVDRPAILLEDGRIVDYDGTSDVTFLGVDSTSYYVVVRHRNHGDVMSAAPVDFSSGSGSVNFRTSMAAAYQNTGNPMKQIGSLFAMFGGDINIDAQVTASDYNEWVAQTKAADKGYVWADIDLDGQVTASDFNIWLTNTKAGFHSQVPP